MYFDEIRVNAGLSPRPINHITDEAEEEEEEVLKTYKARTSTGAREREGGSKSLLCSNEIEGGKRRA